MIYVIHLSRRPDRKKILEEIADKLRLKLTFVEAVDGKNLTNESIEKLGIKLLPGFVDPFTKRTSMTFGEIGCALSHFYIWEDIVTKGLKKALILEDDANFVPMFRRQWSRISADVDEFVPIWDLIYFGRRLMRADKETLVKGSNFLVWPQYSSWANAYALTRNGAIKLLKQKPLTKLMPVDEYIPLMYDRPAVEEWKQFFRPRDVIAVSVYPLLIEPAWFPGDQKYVSDTELSSIVNFN